MFFFSSSLEPLLLAVLKEIYDLLVLSDPYFSMKLYVIVFSLLCFALWRIVQLCYTNSILECSFISQKTVFVSEVTERE